MFRFKKFMKTAIILIGFIQVFYLYLKFKSNNLSVGFFDAANEPKDVNYYYLSLFEANTAYQLYNLFTDERQNRLYVKYAGQEEANSSATNSHKRIKQNKVYLTNELVAVPPKNVYVIVEYTTIFDRTKYCGLSKQLDVKQFIKQKPVYRRLVEENKKYVDNEPFDLLDKCQYKNCYFTCNKDAARFADMLLFHQTDLQNILASEPNVGSPMNEKYAQKENILKLKRDYDQIWTLWNDEANMVSADLDWLKFNWTISYQAKSEASYCAYGCVVRSQNEHLLNAEKYFTYVRVEFERRQNAAFWFVSNCGPKMRMKYAVELGAHFPNSIFGKCNDEMRKSYAKQAVYKYLHFNDTACSRETGCEMDVFRSNKFYLSLENQNCSDYITEKFWKSLTNDLIPIVLQPNREYYEKIAPKNSYIHMADFDYDLAKLGSYLNQVSTNFTLYSTYFEWKKEYKAVYDGKTLEQFRICELCFKLNNQNSKHKSYYSQVSNYFNNACVREK